MLLESGEWLSRRPYHRQRLAWILLSQRSFAIEAAEAGFHVVYLRGDAPMVDLIRGANLDRTLQGMEPAER
ncbi:MAG: Deoxyribodipyrimidine photo-lyase-related protein, partial [Planctomycetota bacterium]